MSTTQQPVWKLIANLGDAHPLDYGGYFVYVDETGTYEPEAELLDVPDERTNCPICAGSGSYEKTDTWGHELSADCSACSGTGHDDTKAEYEIRRFPLTRCTIQNGILSDNKFHPDHMAWFGYRDTDRPQDSDLNDVARFADMPDIAELLCSENPIDRAHAYRAIGEYHGWDNLDSYPLTLTRAEAKARFTWEKFPEGVDI